MTLAMFDPRVAEALASVNRESFVTPRESFALVRLPPDWEDTKAGRPWAFGVVDVAGRLGGTEIRFADTPGTGADPDAAVRDYFDKVRAQREQHLANEVEGAERANRRAAAAAEVCAMLGKP